MKIMFIVAIMSIVPGVVYSSECVILLHGLARSAGSMEKLENILQTKGYAVVNVDYPSRKKKIEELSELAVSKGMDECVRLNADGVHFVTHSLGGILVRQYFTKHAPVKVKRVVMLGPPNQGSEVVDYMKEIPGFEWVNGPAGMQLGTDEGSIPNQLGPVNFELGVIAGTRSINWILSMLLPGEDDGKVTLKNTHVSGMCEFIAIPTTHTLMMYSNKVIDQVVYYLDTGHFRDDKAVCLDCVFRSKQIVFAE